MTKLKHKRKKINWTTRIFNSLSLPALILTPDKIIQDVNTTFLQRFNIKKDQIVGKTCHDFFYRSHTPCLFNECPLSSVLAEKQGHSALRKLMTPMGEEIWDDRVFSPIMNEDGEVEYIIETLRDITRVKILERELSGVKDFTEKVIESSTSAIIAADREGKLLVMNRAAEELTGYSFREAKEKITVDCLHPPGQAREIMSLLRDESFGGKGKLPCISLSLLNSKGVEIPVDLTAAIIYEGDREIATMGIFHDLREKLLQEQRMKKFSARIAQAEKMASIGKLAAGVAHEINNPLTGILFSISMVMEKLDTEDPRRQDLELAIEDVNRCKEIIKSLLIYSRQTNVKKEIIHINILLEESLSLIRDQKLFMKVRIEKELSDELMFVEVDRNQMNQVLINLVMNALDAMNMNGMITFRSYINKTSNRVCLEISDTGCGIASENFPRIFDPFFTTKEPGKGTGLGLSTVHGMVTEMGGDVWVKETSAEGTIFVLELPLYQPPDDFYDFPLN